MSGLLGQMLGKFSGAGAGESGAVQGVLQDMLGGAQGGGFSGLIQQFESAGLGAHVRSWIGTGQNMPITAEQVQQVLSNEQVQAFVQRTGLPVQALMPILATVLPHAIDQATPNGQVPSDGATSADSNVKPADSTDDTDSSSPTGAQ